MSDKPSPETIAAFSERLRDFQSALEDAEYLYSRVRTHPGWPATAAANPDAAMVADQIRGALDQFREGTRLMTEQIANSTVTQEDIVTCDEAHARFKQSLTMFRSTCQTLLDYLDALPLTHPRNLN